MSVNASGILQTSPKC